MPRALVDTFNSLLEYEKEEEYYVYCLYAWKNQHSEEYDWPKTFMEDQMMHYYPWFEVIA